MPKVLVEIKNGAIMSVETTSDDREVYVVDHDILNDGGTGELKCYLPDMDAPIEVDAVALEDDLMAKVEDLIAERNNRLEDRADAWEDGEKDEVPDLTRVMWSRR